MTDDSGFCRLLEVAMPVTLGTVNVYLIRTDDGVTLIDTGMNSPASMTTLEEQLAREGLSTADVRTVLCTHYHPDHCGLAATLQRSGARVFISQTDAEALRDYFSNPQHDHERTHFFGRHRMPRDPQDRIGGMSRLLRSLHSAFTPDGTFRDGDRISAGGVSLEVCLCPGHTPGHAVFVCHEHRTVFTGDHLIDDQISSISIRDGGPDEDMMGAMFASLEKMSRFAGYVGLSGHGRPIQDIAERADHTARFHRARLKRLAELLTSTPEHAETLGILAFGEKKRTYSCWLSLSSTIALLNLLAASGVARVTRSPEGFDLYSRADDCP